MGRITSRPALLPSSPGEDDSPKPPRNIMRGAPQFSVRNCVDVAVTILWAGRCLVYIKCPHCSSAYLDGCPDPHLVTCIPLVANRGP